MTAPDQTGITVQFSRKVARVLECSTPSDRIEFTVDAGPGGKDSICLEHHPRSWPRTAFYATAFAAAHRYLRECGYEVEIYGE